jgi:hypothetical protein
VVLQVEQGTIPARQEGQVVDVVDNGLGSFIGHAASPQASLSLHEGTPGVPLQLERPDQPWCQSPRMTFQRARLPIIRIPTARLAPPESYRSWPYMPRFP